MGVFTFDVDEFMELATGSQLPATPSGSGMRRSASSSGPLPPRPAPRRADRPHQSPWPPQT